MSANTCVITNYPDQRFRLTKYFATQPLIKPTFPRNLQQIFELAQQSTLLVIVVALQKAPKATKKICHSLKKNPLTQNIPVVLVKNPGIQEQEQWADAYLTSDFNARDVEQVIRQLTMGY